jgi:hypothetical protein
LVTPFVFDANFQTHPKQKKIELDANYFPPRVRNLSSTIQLHATVYASITKIHIRYLKNGRKIIIFYIGRG